MFPCHGTGSQGTRGNLQFSSEKLLKDEIKNCQATLTCKGLIASLGSRCDDYCVMIVVCNEWGGS